MNWLYIINLYLGMKHEVGFQEYLDLVMEVGFVWALMGGLRSWVCMLVGIGHRSVLLVGTARSQLSMFFLSVQQTILRNTPFEDMKQFFSWKL